MILRLSTNIFGPNLKNIPNDLIFTNAQVIKLRKKTRIFRSKAEKSLTH